MMSFCETMSNLYQITPSLPASILLGGVGGIVVSALGATRGRVALVAFGAYFMLGAGILSGAAMHNTHPFRVIKETKDRLNTLPAAIICHTLSLAAPLFAPPLFVLSRISQNTPAPVFDVDTAINNISFACNALSQYIKSGQLAEHDSAERLNEFKVIYEFINENVKAINAHSFKILSKKQDQLNKLFFETLQSHDYDHGQIAYDGALEQVLAPYVTASHHLGDEEIVDSVSRKKIKETIAEAQFSIRLGIKFENTDSKYHEAYYILDRFKNRLGVYKPAVKQNANEDLYGASEIREAHLAEVANSAIAQFLELEIVPHTVLFEAVFNASRSIGSFQFYVKDAISLYDCLSSGGDLWDADYVALQERLNTEAIQGMAFNNFEELAFFDMLTANNDRHFKNILYLPSEGKLIAIDNGNSFPWTHDANLPHYKTRPLHWFRWRVLPQSQEPFSERTVKKINAFAIEKIEEIARSYLIDERTPSSVELIEGKVNTLYQRSAEIRKLANQNIKISDIALSVLQLRDSQHSQSTKK